VASNAKSHPHAAGVRLEEAVAARHEGPGRVCAECAYLDIAGHGPLFRLLRPNGKRGDERRPMDPNAIDRVVRKFATGLGLDRGYSAQSMRFVTTALENGDQLEDVQKAAGHRDSGTTKLYDRRGYIPAKAAFFATY
jgi:integrase/recombinase XerD